jgi:transcriptional regulator with XRE-family HTH domain
MPNDPDLVLLGKRIQQIRREQGISQEDFANKHGIGRSYLSGIERGARNITVKKLLQIQRCLGVPMASLFEWSEFGDT